MSNEIKPCPFCGEIPEIHEDRQGWWVDCINDYCPTQPHNQEPYHMKKDAISAWNSRKPLFTDLREFINLSANKFLEILDNKRDIEFLLSLVPNWAKFVPKGLYPMLYGTGSYEGDLEVKNRINEIYKKWNIERKTELLDKQPK